MLDRLRRQFILIIMALVTAALVIMAGVVVYLNYQQLTNDVMQAVEYATSARAFEPRTMGGGLPQGTHDGAAFPRGAAGGYGNFSDGAGVLGDSDDLDDDEDDDWDDDLDDFYGDLDDRWDDEDELGRIERGAGADMVATSVYLVANGAVSTTLVDALELETATRDEALAQVLALHAQGTAEGASGHLGAQGLYYSIRDTPSGLKVAFASDAYVGNSIGNLALVLGIVSVCVWIAFLLVSIVLARWVVQPTQRAWAQQQQFVADASHELKTPLAVMMANNSILLSHPDDTIGSQLRWVESSQHEAREMLGLVNDMLFLARPENAERQMVREKVDLSSLVQRNVLQFEAVCFERRIRLDSDVAGGVAVTGDANRLQRLVSTLIDNACKYADSRVSVRLSRENGRAVLAVSNDGATIPAEDLPHVFDRFYRVDKARVRSEGGVGLGLAIAQEVAHEHAGSITVASSAQAGTTFTATLPC